MSRRITQREGVRLRQRVKELENVIRRERMVYGQEWIGAVHIDTVTLTAEEASIVRTARRLGHAVIAMNDGDGTNVRFVALPHPKVTV